MRPARRTNAFTILELLVAAAISMILVVMLLTSMRGISANYTRTQSQVIRQGDSSLAVDQIVQDLEGIVIPNYARGEGLRITPEASQIGQTTNAVWLTLLTAATDSDTSDPSSSTNGMDANFTGATRAVSYRLALQNSIDGTGADPKSYALYRSIASARHTFENIGTNTTNLQTQYWGSLAASPAPSPLPPTHPDSFLAENIVAFQVRFLRADNGQWTSAGQDIRIGRDGVTVDGQEVAGGFTRAEVGVTVLTPEGAQRVRDGVLTLQKAIDQYGRTAVRQTSTF